MLILNQPIGAKLSGYADFVLKLLPGGLYKKASKILEQVQVFQTVPLSFHLKAAFITVLSGVITVIIYILAAKSAGITVPTGVFVWQCALIYILGRFPMSVANVGVREFTLVETLAQYGVVAPDALLMSMIIFSNLVMLALIGSAYQLFGWQSQKSQLDS